MKYVPLSYIDPPSGSGSSDTAEKVVLWKFDSFSGVWENSTLYEVTDYFSISGITEGFWRDAAPTISSAAYGNVVRFVFNFIVFEVKLYEFQKALALLNIDPSEGGLSKIPDFEFSSIRVATNGKGLDYLRECGVEVESLLRKQHPKMHPTRVDIAIDFFNYGNDFLTDLCKFATARKQNLTPTGRISVLGQTGGLNFTVKNGASETTFYFGSPSSNKLLRIYDKFKERVHAGHGTFSESVFYRPSSDSDAVEIPVKSWLRFEWQLRNSDAVEKLYSRYTGSFGEAIICEIWNYYQVKSYNAEKVARFWMKFFNPTNYKSRVYETLILYNSEGGHTAAQIRLDNFIERNIAAIYVYVATHRSGFLMKQLRTFEKYLHCALDDDIDDSIRLARLGAVKKRLAELSPTGEIDYFVRVNTDRTSFYAPSLDVLDRFGSDCEWADLYNAGIGEDD